MKRSALALVAAVGMLTAASYMTVSFDIGTGAGWVGKGDVQTAFAWNNKVMQDRHKSVVFDFDQTTEYTWVCEWTTGEGTRGERTHSQTKTHTYSIGGMLAATDRKTGQYTGWHLNGYTSGGPGTGDASFTPGCPGNEEGGGTSGEKVVREGSVVANVIANGLYARYGADRRLLAMPLPL